LLPSLTTLKMGASGGVGAIHPDNDNITTTTPIIKNKAFHLTNFFIFESPFLDVYNSCFDL